MIVNRSYAMGELFHIITAVHAPGWLAAVVPLIGSTAEWHQDPADGTGLNVEVRWSNPEGLIQRTLARSPLSDPEIRNQATACGSKRENCETAVGSGQLWPTGIERAIKDRTKVTCE